MTIRASRISSATLASELPGPHFDGRLTERPFLVGLGRVFCRPTKDANWIASRTWTRCSGSSLTDDHFFVPGNFGPKQCATQAMTLLRSWPSAPSFVVTQGGSEDDRPHFPTGTWPIPSNPGRIQEVATGSGGSAASGRASRATRSAPISQPSEVGDGLQFVSALLAPANSSAGLCQASSPTSPRSLPDANCFDLLVSASRKPLPRPVQRPRPCQSHVQRLPQLRGLYAMLGPNNRAAKDTGRYSRGPAPNLLA